MPPRLLSLRRLVSCLAATLFATLVACHDAPAPTAAATDVAQRHQRPLRDPAIRRDDSHFTARVRVTRDVGDALLVAADAQLAPETALPTTSYVVEAGYGASGELRFGVYWDVPTPTFSFGGMRSIGNQLEALDAAGRVISTQPFDVALAVAGLPSGSLIGAFLLSEEPGVDTCAAGDPACGPSASLRDASVRAETPIGGMKEVRRSTRPDAARSGSSATNRSELVQRYRRVSATAWRLEEATQLDVREGPSGTVATRTHTAISYGVWHRNELRDASRVTASLAHAPTAAAVAPAPTRTINDANLIEKLCARGPTNIDVRRSKSLRGLSLVYQHGFCGEATQFDGMRPLLANAFTVDRERAFNLASTEAVESQVTDLIALLHNSGARPNVVIGTSLGGLIARRLGQRDPSLVSGVISIGTPHSGALLADAGADLAAQALAGSIGGLCVGEWLCEVLTELLIARNGGRLLMGAPGLLAPSVVDMATGSPFLTTLNSTYETFPRASIEVDAGNRWALFRVLGDMRSPRSRVLKGQRPDGNYWVDRVESIYWTSFFVQILTFFANFYVAPVGGSIDCSQSGYSTLWEPCNDLAATSWASPWMQDYLRFLLYQLALIITATLDRVDYTWDWLTTRGRDRTDGVVAASSQRYPSVPGTHAPMRVLITPPQADSHLGATASPIVVTKTIDTIRLLGLGGL